MCRHKNLIIILMAVALLVPTIGCSVNELEPVKAVGIQPFLKDRNVKKKVDSTVTAEQDAILRVLDENKTHFKSGFEFITTESQPTAVTKMFGTYLDKIDKIDLKNCPLEFRGAWSRYVKAWKALHTKIGRLPDAYEDVTFMDALQSTFRNETEKGKVLGGDVMQAVKQVVTTYAELFSALSVYQIDVSN